MGPRNQRPGDDRGQAARAWTGVAAGLYTDLSGGVCRASLSIDESHALSEVV